MTSILRIASPSESLTSSLVDALCSHFGTIKDSGHVLNISNRYFDAAVALEPLSLNANSSSSSSSILGSEDALVLVFDGASENALDVLANLHTTAEGQGQNGDLLRLCIGILDDANSPAVTTSTLPGTKEHEEEYASRILWCLDRGYEYIERVNLSSPEAIKQGHDEREKEGFARVVEAIEGTVWSSAQMHTQKQQQLKESYSNTQQQLVEDNETENMYEPPPTTLPMPSVMISEDESKEREAKARAALLKQDQLKLDDDDDDAFLGNDNTPLDQENDQRAERIFSDMEGALKEANRIRDMSKAGELSDEDRHQRAGDAAKLLMNLMEQMGGMDSDSDEEEDHIDSEEENVAG